ncbi:hypothetical protein QTP88_024768 [Uroleucon formosanum]
MKTNGAVLRAFFTFALLVVVSGLSDDTWSVVSNATGRAMQRDNHCILHMDDIYRVNYCSNRTCPSWKCQDDSAIIHGTCCGCPNIFGGISETNSKTISKIYIEKTPFSNYCERAEKMLLKNQLSTNIDTENELKRPVDFIDTQFYDFNKEVNSMEEEIKTLKTENKKIYNENKYKSNEISIIKLKTNIVEQINFRNFVYITGIIPTENENLPEIVKEIGLKTNTKIKVIVATRLYMNNLSKSVIVSQLETIEMKRNLIYNSKASKLTANNILNNWPKKNQIHIDKRLTNYR